MSAAAVPWWREPTRRQWVAFSAAWLGWVLDAFDFTLFLLVEKAICDEFGVPLSTTGLITALTLLVRLLGSAAAGWAADRWGRRLPLMLSMLWFATCDGALYFSSSLTWVLVFRVLFGFGMGGEWTAGTTLAMESWPRRSRAIASGVLQGSWAIGYVLAAVVAGYVVPRYGWRPLFLVAAAPALLVVPIRLWVKEDGHARAARGGDTRFRALLEAGVWRRMVWASLGMSLGMAIYYALVSKYVPMQVAELGVPFVGAMQNTIVFNLGFLVGAVACGALAKRRGVVAAVVVPALLGVPALLLYVGLVPGWLTVGAFLAGGLGVGWAGIVPVYLTGLFAPHLRAKAVGVVYHVGAAAGAGINWLLPWVHQRSGLPLSACIFAFAATFQLTLALLLWLQPRELAGEAPATAPRPTRAPAPWPETSPEARPA